MNVVTPSNTGGILLSTGYQDRDNVESAKPTIVHLTTTFLSREALCLVELTGGTSAPLYGRVQDTHLGMRMGCIRHAESMTEARKGSERIQSGFTSGGSILLIPTGRLYTMAGPINDSFRYKLKNVPKIMALIQSLHSSRALTGHHILRHQDVHRALHASKWHFLREGALVKA